MSNSNISKPLISEHAAYKMLVQAFPDIPSIVIEKVLDNCQFDCNEAVQCLLAGANQLELSPKPDYPDSLKWEVFWNDFYAPPWDFPKLVAQLQSSLGKLASTRNKIPNTLLGSEIVDWFFDNSTIRTRGEVEELGQRMINEGWIEGASIKKSRNQDDKIFKDSEDMFYWFPTKGRIGPKTSQPVNLSNPPPSATSINDFERIKFLGKGASGIVWVVEHKSTHKLYAMKDIPKAVLQKDQDSFRLLRTEKEVLIRCAKCPFIVNLYYAFQTPHCFHFVLDLIDGGDVSTFLKKKKKFSKETCRILGAQLIIILEFLHEHNILYRDLKPSNLIFDADGHLCLTDFNFASTNAEHGKHNPLGSPAYTAPEVFSGVYGKAVDWWSFGIVMHYLLVGHPPYRASSIEEMMNLIKNTPVPFSEALSGSSKSLLQLLLEKDENKRLENVTKLKSHKFFKKINWEKIRHKKTQSPLSTIENSN